MTQHTPDLPLGGKYVPIEDTRLFVVERGNGYPLFILHGGPGLDHREFGDYLDPLADRYRLILVDQRAQGRSDDCPEDTWSLGQMAKDVVSLAKAMGFEKYAVLGHSYGAMVALQNAVDFPGTAAQTIVSCGMPSSSYLSRVDDNLRKFEPVSLREQVANSWARESQAKTPEDMDSIMHDQMPFHFGNPLDPRIADYEARSAGGIGSPKVLQHFAKQGYGGIEVVDRLPSITQPTLVLAGRHDRTCPVEASEAMARGIPNAELVVFEASGHMTFVEENERYTQVVRDFLDRTTG
jgi:proline iminopeptidase